MKYRCSGVFERTLGTGLLGNDNVHSTYELPNAFSTRVSSFELAFLFSNSLGQGHGGWPHSLGQRMIHEYGMAAI